MKRLAEFILQGLPHAVLAAAGFAVLGLLLPPFGIVSSAVVALVALKVGLRQAVYVTLISSTLLAVAVLAMRHPPIIGILSGMAQWLPAALLGALLGRTVSWTLVMQAAFVTGIIAIVALYLLFPDIDRFWVETFRQLLQPALQQGSGQEAQAIGKGLESVAPLMTGILVSAFVLTALLSLMLARSMQAALENPGGFAREFQALRIGVWPAGLAILFVVLATLTGAAWANALAAVAMTVFMLQGFALVHAMVARIGWPKGSIIGLYVLLVIFLTPVVVVMASLGVVDAFADFRRRLDGAAE